MPRSAKYVILFAFDGSDFCGWQVQGGVRRQSDRKPSIESKMVEAIRESCGESVVVVASGRTDAGVHASGQVAHFSLSKPYPSEEHFLDALNERLPTSIRILHIEKCDESFQANRSEKKQYSYYFQQGPANLPHLQRYSMWNRRSLDFEAMHDAIQHLVGEHDFMAFSSSMTNVTSTVRTVFEADVSAMDIPVPGEFGGTQQALIRVRIVGSGFLRQMVRRLAGTLKKVGEGRVLPQEVGAILKGRDRDQTGPTAPAGGLWLDRVWYAQDAGVDFLSGVTGAEGAD